MDSARRPDAALLLVAVKARARGSLAEVVVHGVFLVATHNSHQPEASSRYALQVVNALVLGKGRGNRPMREEVVKRCNRGEDEIDGNSHRLDSVRTS